MCLVSGELCPLDSPVKYSQRLNKARYTTGIDAECDPEGLEPNTNQHTPVKLQKCCLLTYMMH